MGQRASALHSPKGVTAVVEFYRLSFGLRVFMILLSTLGVVAQASNLTLGLLRFRPGRARAVESLFETAILAQIFLCSMLVAQLQFSSEHGYIAGAGYNAVRYVVFGVLALLAGAAALSRRSFFPATTVLFAMVTLPVAEPLFSAAFPAVFCAALLFWLLRGVVLGLRCYRELRTGLSRLSVKQAIDKLPSGVLLYEPNGMIVLLNARMQSLMALLTGKVFRNGVLFYDALKSADENAPFEKREMNERLVCVLQEGGAWMFAKSDLVIGQKRYLFLSATDIAQQWRITQDLQRQNLLLAQRGAELEQTLENIHAICRQRVLLRAKNRAHDVLGQRLSLLLRALQQDESLPENLLSTLADELLGEIKSDAAQTPREELRVLQETFGLIGVAVDFLGPLPEESKQAAAVIGIVREAVTNAVRHATAVRVDIRAEMAPPGYRLTITDNGTIPAKPIAEGGGIGQMRRSAARFGGRIDIETQPQFKITVQLPRGGHDDESPDR